MFLVDGPVADMLATLTDVRVTVTRRNDGKCIVVIEPLTESPLDYLILRAVLNTLRALGYN